WEPKPPNPSPTRTSSRSSTLGEPGIKYGRANIRSRIEGGWRGQRGRFSSPIIFCGYLPAESRRSERSGAESRRLFPVSSPPVRRRTHIGPSNREAPALHGWTLKQDHSGD